MLTIDVSALRMHAHDAHTGKQDENVTLLLTLSGEGVQKLSDKQ